MKKVPPPEHPASHLTTTEERLARLSVLQELTVMALGLFDPEMSPDPFLERLAERLGSLAALWVAIEPDRHVVLVGAAGISEASRAVQIPAPETPSDPESLTLRHPEISRDDLVRWTFRLSPGPTKGRESCHALLLWFDPERRPPDEYLAAVERLVGVLHTVLAHRQLTQELRRSYEELARTQLALVERERLAAIGELAAVVAHEIRNPLAVIFNCVGSLQKAEGPADGAKALLGILSEEAHRLNQIVSELLEFARPGEVMMLTESLEDVLTGAVNAVRSAQSTPVKIELELARARRPQMFDSRLVRRAVINLVTNAVQAMPSGGRVVVRLTDEERDGAVAAVVTVTDEGPGVPPALVPRIFEPFFTTRASGTGLGLSIVKHVADVHHGEVSVQSSEGRGATFVLRLPSATA